MDQIICDICGSAYPDTAERCPVCSYPRQGNEKTVQTQDQSQRTKVKGGRFSNKNVRKRRRAQLRREQDGSNRGLWITIILLLIAIFLVSAYIALRFWDGRGSFTGGTQTTQPPVITTTAPTDPKVPCQGVTLDMTVAEFEEAGEQVSLGVKTQPENTTDAVTYASADTAVARVSEDGILTAVGPGQTTVTVTCGEVRAECTVICWFREETTAPSETTVPTEATEPAVLELDHLDVSLFQPGEQFTIKVMLGGEYIGRSQVTWTTSDPAIAEVEKGVVTAVGPGVATITAQYRGMKAQCIVRCQFRDTAWRASATDVTLAVGDSFRLTIHNSSGETADAVWTMDKEGVVSMDGDTVTALKTGTVTLSAKVDGVKVWCIVRVK